MKDQRLLKTFGVQSFNRNEVTGVSLLAARSLKPRLMPPSVLDWDVLARGFAGRLSLKPESPCVTRHRLKRKKVTVKFDAARPRIVGISGTRPHRLPER